MQCKIQKSSYCALRCGSLVVSQAVLDEILHLDLGAVPSSGWSSLIYHDGIKAK